MRSAGSECREVNSISNVQFLVFYKFTNTKSMSDIGVIGMLTYKLDKESLWVTPTLLDCQNQL